MSQHRIPYTGYGTMTLLDVNPDWPTLLQPAYSAPCSIHLQNKRVLITGAGGSLGSALALAAHASSAKSLVLLDTSENALYQIDRTLTETGCRSHIPTLGSIHDTAHLFQTYRPEIVLHAAALKQVPLMEGNPFAAIHTNALGTLAIAQTAAAHGTEHLLLLSTDKAADPASMMGASKRLAELAVLAAGGETRTRMTALRLGNVLGTQGSVLPLFLDQIARNLPLTVTHPDATRFFLPLDRAVVTILDALAHRPTPSLLVPELAPPLRILDLAQHLLTLHPGTSKIEFTGLRPGDKLHEILLSTREHLLPGTRQVVTPIPSFSVLQEAFAVLARAVTQRDIPSLLKAIATLVPEYIPSSVVQETQA